MFCTAVFRGTETEALLQAIKSILSCYAEEHPKQKNWQDQLKRVYAAIESENQKAN